MNELSSAVEGFISALEAWRTDCDGGFCSHGLTPCPFSSAQLRRLGALTERLERALHGNCLFARMPMRLRLAGERRFLARAKVVIAKIAGEVGEHRQDTPFDELARAFYRMDDMSARYLRELEHFNRFLGKKRR